MLLNKEKYTTIDLGNLENNRIVCLTLDLEQDYGNLLDEPSYEGLQYISDLVNFFNEKNISLTCFVQGSLLETHPTEIEQLFALDVEFELHSYSHPGVKEMDAEFEIKRGKEAYRKFFGKEPLGYRAPLGFIGREIYNILVSEGFKFDSSIFPSLRPGVFNNLSKPTRPYLLNNPGILEFPLTVVSDLVRIPIALSYIRLLGKPYFHLVKTFKLANLIIFDFHLHDLFDLGYLNKISPKNLSPMYRLIFNRLYGQQKSDGFDILDRLIGLFRQKGYAFSKLIDVYNLLVEPVETKV